MARTEGEQRRWLVRHAVEVLRSLGIAPGRTVLDFGCGDGVFAVPAAELVGPDGTVYALDRDRDKLSALTSSVADTGLSNLRVIHTSGELSVPLPDESCDVALIYDVLQLVDDWPTFFAEARRVLKPSGTLSVYPMHVDRQRVKRECLDAGFREAAAPEPLLNFIKPRTRREQEE